MPGVERNSVQRNPLSAAPVPHQKRLASMSACHARTIPAEWHSLSKTSPMTIYSELVPRRQPGPSVGGHMSQRNIVLVAATLFVTLSLSKFCASEDCEVLKA